MSVDYPDWMPQSQLMLDAWLGVTRQIASLIATGNAAGAPGGVPLLTLNNVLDKLTNQNIAAGGQYLSAALPILQPSYDIWVETSIAAGNTQPDLELTLSWSDSSIGGSVMSQETWLLPCTQNGVNTFGGRGLSKGDTLSVQMNNLDTAKPVTVSYGISQHSRLVQRDDIRSVAYNGRAAVQAFPCLPTANVLATFRGNIASGASQTGMLPLFSGKARVSTIEVSVATRIEIQCLALIDSPGPSLSGGYVYDSGAIAANATVEQVVALPRGVCLLTFENNGATTQTCTIMVTAEDY